METFSTIEYPDFSKVEMRTGTISKAERIPKSNKMIQLEVYFGTEIGNRTILAGIGKDFEPENLIGTQIVAVLNLVPREMFGVQSNGMLLATKGMDGKLVLANCPGAPDGSLLG